jgi:RecB family exonuclease
VPAALLISPAAPERVARARAWLAGRAAAEEVLVVAATQGAASELLRAAAVQAETGAAFGWHRVTLGGLAAALAAPALAEAGRVPVGRLACEAVAARALHALAREGRLGRWADAAAGPGFARAAANVCGELRLAAVAPQALGGGEAAEPAAAKRAGDGRDGEVAPELRVLLGAYEAELAAAGLADRAEVFRLAASAARDTAFRHPLLGLPTLLLDVPVETEAEAALVAALAERAPELLVTVPSGDAATLARLRDVPDLQVETVASLAGAPAAGAAGPATPGEADACPAGALARLQAHLFEEAAPPLGALDDEVVVLSAPGEGRECVEIARRILGFAKQGVPFDRMAVLLRSPEEYRPHLAEAFTRAGIPAFFSQGSRLPDPAGRAFLALLACAAERLSARRFAEYLSLGEVPDATAAGAPPPAPPPGERWVAPEEEMVPAVVAEALAAAAVQAVGGDADPAAPADGAADPEVAPVSAGTLRAPRRWERLLVDAAVIGGRERWERRLAGLEGELRQDLEELDDPEGARADLLRRDLDDLAALRGFALPLLDVLAALPREAQAPEAGAASRTARERPWPQRPAEGRQGAASREASEGPWRWGDWLETLSELAVRALRHPERVLAVLSELSPMAAAGPVGLAEVRLVLGRRLLEIAVPPPKSRHGRVFVAPCDAARGLAFDVVFVPGLAERLFPRKIQEEPLLLDDARRRLGLAGEEAEGGSAPGPALLPTALLPTNADRIARERLALRVAVGAAARRLVLSWPRLDLDQSRPRVPSFYALEALRAAEGVLPGFDELAARAERVAEARVGWPAPRRREDAIDEAEHDLALLDALLRQEPDTSVGTARFLLEANPHLGRALRFRARRWGLSGWSEADGLVAPRRGGLAAGAAEALAGQQLAARSFSPTALEHFSACPYRFHLQAVQRLAPREAPEAIDEMDPLQRGSLVHDVQFELFQRLRADGLLPVRAANLARAQEALEAVLAGVAERHRDELAPAIPRVWEDGVASVRADLREWLRRCAEDDSGYVPFRFELAFGLPERRQRDPGSRPDPVELECGIRLRGSIDLVERSADGRVRVTDHKTGRERAKEGAVVAGGASLQPVLYALAAEKLFPHDRVEGGRLSYCTVAGGFGEVFVPLGPAARESAARVAEAVDHALAEPFLPAAPAKGACRWCDYAVVCGPYEELRTARKRRQHPQIERLVALRELP